MNDIVRVENTDKRPGIIDESLPQKGKPYAHRFTDALAMNGHKGRHPRA